MTVEREINSLLRRAIALGHTRTSLARACNLSPNALRELDLSLMSDSQLGGANLTVSTIRAIESAVERGEARGAPVGEDRVSPALADAAEGNVIQTIHQLRTRAEFNQRAIQTAAEDILRLARGDEDSSVEALADAIAEHSRSLSAAGLGRPGRELDLERRDGLARIMERCVLSKRVRKTSSGGHAKAHLTDVAAALLPQIAYVTDYWRARGPRRRLRGGDSA